MKLYGEGNYALSAIKEVDVTDAFLSLDEEDKLCQNVETFLECQANAFIKLGLEKCNCTPYEIRNFSKTVCLKKIDIL